MARGSDGESVLHKHLRVLETFDALRPFLTLREISETAGLAPSTAHRLVAELESEGLLERLPDRSYRLGVRLWEFASRTPGALGLREVARPWMNAVHSRIAQHTQLGVLSGTDVLFIERMSTRGAVVNATIIGGRLPLAVSSSGMVLLAHTEDAVEDVVRVGWRRYTSQTLPDAAALRERLRHTRADGFAVMDGHIYEGSRGIAVPVVGPNGGVYAALGVVVPVTDESPTGTIELLTVAAAGITRALADAFLPEASAVNAQARRSVGPLVSTSEASIEYFAHLGL
jgi:DNA-binding IclR family transcriptional regulator